MSTNQGELGNWEECTGQVNEWMNEYSRHASLGTNITIPSESEDVLISSMQKTKNKKKTTVMKSSSKKQRVTKSLGQWEPKVIPT